MRYDIWSEIVRGIMAPLFRIHRDQSLVFAEVRTIFESQPNETPDADNPVQPTISEIDRFRTHKVQ